MTRVLVVGGTGRVGREVLAELATTGAHVRALVRDPNAAGLPPEIEVVRGDLADPDSLDEPLRDVDAVFLVWTAPAAAAGPALSRITQHVRRIVYLSAPIHTPHPFFQASLPNPASVLHEEIEALIERSGIERTILRPGMFASNALGWWAMPVRAGDVVRWPHLAAATAPIDERDVAAVAVRTLLDGNHAGAEDYVLTGPESLTQGEQLAEIGRAIGRPVHVEELSPEAARHEWTATGWPGPVVDMLLASWAAAVGRPAYVTDCIATITGTPARTFSQWAGDHADAFRS